MGTPFFDEIAAVADRKPRFFVPGHKGNPAAIPIFADYLHYDITEVDGAYDLSHPTGALAESQNNMARLYGSGATLYSASGSTNCILAMIALFTQPGDTIIAARGCHVSALRAMALLDLHPHWIDLVQGLPRPQDIEQALQSYPGATVYVTSVDYYGNIPDIEAISAICKANNANLLCDNAHGAHLAFLKNSCHPIRLGADAAADSAHKTLPCLTPAAMLHLKDKELAGPARQQMNLFSSTSPSYPVLLSLDLAAGFLEDQAQVYQHTQQQVALLGEKFPFLHPCQDPLRLVLSVPPDQDVDGVHQFLLEHKIAAEYSDGRCFVFMFSPWNTLSEFEYFNSVMRDIHNQFEFLSNFNCLNNNFDRLSISSIRNIQKSHLTLREAFFSPKETLATRQAKGRICAGLHAPCPPGVPLLAPGELLRPDICNALVAGGIMQVDVVK